MTQSNKKQSKTHFGHFVFCQFEFFSSFNPLTDRLVIGGKVTGKSSNGTGTT